QLDTRLRPQPGQRRALQLLAETGALAEHDDQGGAGHAAHIGQRRTTAALRMAARTGTGGVERTEPGSGPGGGGGADPATLEEGLAGFQVEAGMRGRAPGKLARGRRG